MKKGEEKSFQDLGLGRGVDATNPTPWLNKRPLQIREVRYDDIIGTEEGNLYQGFVNEVESTQHFQTNLSASVPVNQLVNLGIDSELSRSYSVSQKSVGRKITTRTISFRASFDKICETPQGRVNSQSGKEPMKPFEDRLKEWIRQQKEEDVKKKILEGQQDGEEQQEDEDDEKLAQKDRLDLCYKFISTFSVTHYVHSLELGASYYRVMSQEEYSTKFSSKAKLGVGQLADIAIGNEKSFNAKKYKSQTTQVGRMNLKVRKDEDDSKHKNDKENKNKAKKGDDSTESGKGSEEDEVTKVEEEVVRSSIAEAVVGVKLQPISSLVLDIGLRIALQKALQLYIQNKRKVKCK